MKNFAVIVTYFPDVSVVSSLCRAIVEQNFFVVIVDNSDTGMEFCCGDKCHVILLEKNEGIATAQNIGINYAIERGGDIISFFDIIFFPFTLINFLLAGIDRDNEFLSGRPQFQDPSVFNSITVPSTHISWDVTVLSHHPHLWI